MMVAPAPHLYRSLSAARFGNDPAELRPFGPSARADCSRARISARGNDFNPLAQLSGVVLPETMRKISYSLLLVLLFLVGCASVPSMPAKESSDFRAVPPELVDVDWKRTPNDVLRRPVKDEPLIWLGVVREVFVSHKDGKVEIEWFCEHLSFVEAGPAAISGRPIKARKGEGHFALSLILNDMSIEQALKFKTEHTASPHYILVGGNFAGVVEREGIRVPFLYALRFGLGPNLAVME
jgi:hypothetical protein